SVDGAKQRITFGKPLSERQAIQWRLVDMHVDIEALRAMTYSAAARGHRGGDVRHGASLGRWTAGERGARTPDQMSVIHSAMGEALELPLTVFYRLLRHLQIGGGTTEMQKMLIARELLKYPTHRLIERNNSCPISPPKCKPKLACPAKCKRPPTL